jgi:phosphoglycolate phosphatase
VVSGDTTPHPKPHPAPLLHAATLAGLRPETAVYVGDDLRDIEAGRAAGMTTIAVGYGYLGDGAPVHDWGADFLVESTQALKALVAPG